jgi:hypothetical protein
MDANPNFVLQYKELIVALIAVFGVVIPYLIQRNKEYNLKLVEQKIAAYSEFLRDFTETAVLIAHDEDVEGKETQRQRMLARNQPAEKGAAMKMSLFSEACC